MIECVKARNLTEAIMRRILAILILSSILLSMTGCSKKSPRLDVENFEKYVLSDMGLERKAGATLDAPGYYNMDDTIDNSDASSMKRDHYAQVYSKSEKMPIGEMYMVYTDYQTEDDARNYFTQLVTDEKSMLDSSAIQRTVDEGTDYLLVLTQQTDLRWQFECLYINKDVILFSAIIMATDEINKLDIEWIKQIKELFEDLRIRQPLKLSQQLSDLIK